MTELAVQSMAAFLGGIILNLMPCVLPVIPLKVRAILAELGHDRRQRTLAAMAFLAGSLSLFLVLGLLATLFQLRWGSLFQSRLFVALVAVLFMIAGAFLLLKVRIPLPQFLYRLRGAGNPPDLCQRSA